LGEKNNTANYALHPAKGSAEVELADCIKPSGELFKNMLQAGKEVPQKLNGMKKLLMIFRTFWRSEYEFR
jgi:hypothetical protein